MVSFTQHITVPSDVLMREVAGESVILNLKTETYFGLDEVGTHMWLALTASNTIQQAYESLLNEYDVDPDVLRSDLTKLIEELVSHGLVELGVP
jgi:hypothetical protein